MRCNHCMKEIPNNAKFCPYCGNNPRGDEPRRDTYNEPDQQTAGFNGAGNLDPDAQNRTMFANTAYIPENPEQNAARQEINIPNGEPQYGDFPPDVPPFPNGDNWNGFPQYPQPPAPAPEPKKNNTALIVILITLTALIVAGIGVLTFVIISSNSGDKGENAETTAPASQAASAAAEEKASATASPATTAPPTTAAPTTENPNVKLAAVTGKPLAEAKKALEAQGMTVTIVEEESETVEKGKVIRQSISGDETVQKGTPVTLYVSKGTAKNTKSYDQKVVVTASSGSSYGTLTLYEWENGDWAKKMSCDATVGGDGISSSNNEGNTCTPLGEFPLGVVLSASGQDTGMSVYKVTSATVVCDDVSSGYYNQIGTQSQFGSAHTDPIGKKLMNGQNNALIFIEHNGNGFSAEGVRNDNSSVITICGCTGSLKPTGGCIDISASNMTKLLKLLSAGKKPHIITEVK